MTSLGGTASASGGFGVWSPSDNREHRCRCWCPIDKGRRHEWRRSVGRSSDRLHESPNDLRAKAPPDIRSRLTPRSKPLHGRSIAGKVWMQRLGDNQRIGKASAAFNDAKGIANVE